MFSLGQDYPLQLFECPLEHDGWGARPNQELLFKFYGEDLGHSCKNGKLIAGSVVSLWCTYMHRLLVERYCNVYRFLDPTILRPNFFVVESNVTSYIGRLLGGARKEIYLASYIMHDHWQLLIIHLSRHTVIFPCSLYNAPSKKVVDPINTELKACSISCANGRNRTSKSKGNPEWIILKVGSLLNSN